MKGVIKWLASRCGYEIQKCRVGAVIENNAEACLVELSPNSRISLKSRPRIVDLDALVRIANTIPGMISATSGQLLYALCYMQQLKGDVLEIGSWQGRSSSYLARAVKESGNGHFYAVDHFHGNVGKEHFYVIGKDDLSDLKDGYLSNMSRIGLEPSVHLLDMPNERAVEKLKHIQLRFLFVDGDHSKAGVQKDIALFGPLLLKGAIVVFDDFSSEFPGVIEAVDSFLSQHDVSRVMCYHNTFVLII